MKAGRAAKAMPAVRVEAEAGRAVRLARVTPVGRAKVAPGARVLKDRVEIVRPVIRIVPEMPTAPVVGIRREIALETRTAIVREILAVTVVGTGLAGTPSIAVTLVAAAPEIPRVLLSSLLPAATYL